MRLAFVRNFILNAQFGPHPAGSLISTWSVGLYCIGLFFGWSESFGGHIGHRESESLLLGFVFREGGDKVSRKLDLWSFGFRGGLFGVGHAQTMCALHSLVQLLFSALHTFFSEVGSDP